MPIDHGTALTYPCLLWQCCYHPTNQHPANCAPSMWHYPRWLPYFCSNLPTYPTATAFLLWITSCQGPPGQAKEHPLTIQEQLNIDCNAQASQMHSSPTNMELHYHPKLPAGYLHLCIEQTVVTQRLQHILCDAATSSNYFDYLMTRVTGLLETAQDIQWTIMHHLLNQFKFSEHWIISKFIHEWLPLQDCHHTQSTTQDNTCPSYWQCTEMAEHFLSCQNVDQQQCGTCYMTNFTNTKSRTPSATFFMIF